MNLKPSQTEGNFEQNDNQWQAAQYLQAQIEEFERLEQMEQDAILYQKKMSQTLFYPFFYNKFQSQLKDRLSKIDKKLFDNFYPYGTVFFSNKILKNINIECLGQKVLETIKSEKWSVEVFTNWDWIEWAKLFSLIVQTNLTHLTFKVNQKICSYKILTTIHHTGFNFLQQLSLYECNINNLQPISFLNACNLQNINLIYNNVFQYKCFHKCMFPLKKLFILSKSEQQSFQNRLQPYIRLNNISRWNFKLNDLRLQKYYYNQIIMNDLSFLAKIKSVQKESYTNIRLCKACRINQIKLVSRFQQQKQTQLEISQTLEQSDTPALQISLEFL